MLREREAVVRQAIILLDIIVVAFSFFLAFFLRNYFHSFYKIDLIPSMSAVTDISAIISDYFIILVLIAPSWVISLYANGMYGSLRRKSVIEVIWIIIKSTFFTTLAFGIFVFFFKLKFVSRMFFMMLLTIGTFFLMVEKITMFFFVRQIRKRGYDFRKILLVGTGQRAVQFMKKLENHPEWGLRIVGIVDYDQINRSFSASLTSSRLHNYF